MNNINKFLKNIFSGQLLLKKSQLFNNVPFILYLFLLVIIYITIQYSIRDLAKIASENEDIIKDIKSEYSGKQIQYLNLSKKTHVIKELERQNSLLKEATHPPTIITEGYED